MKELEDKMGIA